MDHGTDEGSRYDAIGGRDGVESLVVKFYERVLADPLLAPFFLDIPIDRLRRMQCEFFTAALGGPGEYQGRVVAHAHQGLDIGRPHFQRFADHLFETLSEFPLDEQDRYDIINRINLYSDDIIGVGSDFSD
ncbi:group I truncated hemoglobin [Solimonas marina]|uniref:Group 1 truncated hemoglobin n=1 Tax=Solimonas marina TaxID=2714601 RepID=A0A969WB54_9GAMM|nr:group 1 truncated hemoglobin [Solimonas marina]NKF23742.1 group 1 truncated hemoglobin [Solimonas marina]